MPTSVSSFLAAPPRPILAPISGIGGISDFRSLVEDYAAIVPLPFGYTLSVTVRAGFVTDGASVPYALQGAFGGPWEMPRLVCALVHDALYQIRWLRCRWLCDRIYRRLSIALGRSHAETDAEYAAIRAAGWRNWKAVSASDAAVSRRDVLVAVLRP